MSSESVTQVIRVFEATSDFLGVADHDGRVLYVNRAGREWLIPKSTRADAGLNLTDFHPPWAQALLRLEGLPTAAREGFWSGITAVCDPQGREIPAHHVVIAHRDPVGGPACYSSVLRSLAAGADRPHTTASPEVAPATAALFSPSPMDTCLHETLAVVAHELRTPLAGVRALAEFLLAADARSAPEFDVFIRNLHDEVVRMSTTVNNLLELAGLGSGSAQWDWTEFALAPLCDEALEPIRNLVDHSRLKLLAGAEPADLRMRGDAAAVRRLLVNLLDNARRHTRTGTIEVTARRLADDPRRLMIEVLDTGEGIQPHVAARLGRPFQLGSGLLGNGYVAGSGLGLVLCRGIAAAHGGHLTVTSRPSGGTCVRVILRADLPEPRPSEVHAPLVCEVTR